MIANEIGYGAEFGGAVTYCLRGRDHAPNPDRCAWVTSRNLPTIDAEVATKIMRHTAYLSTRCKEPVYHFSVDWHPDESPARDEMEAAVEGVLQRLKLAEHQAMFFAHQDAEHPHVHVVLNRIHPDEGRANVRWRSQARLERAVTDMAREMDFLVVPGRHNKLMEPGRKRRPTRGERLRAERAQETPLRPLDKEEVAPLRSVLRAHILESANWSELTSRMKSSGFEIRKKGRGLILTDGEAFLKFSSLGKSGGDRLSRAFVEKWLGESWDAHEEAQARASDRGARERALFTPEHGRDL